MAKRPWKYWSPTFQADTVCPMNPVWPWGGHRRFAYDLVRWMRPARVAELGVHWGTSFFTFLQAVKDGRMAATEVVGVDTFEGEDHAGHYGPEVLDTVNRIIAEYFPKLQIRLYKSLFCDALPHVADESVDLLHIDGLHTYDAVREDFETWLPKLAPEGIILFHDVAPGTGYGSSEFWKELSSAHPAFAFDHSWGLGVLFPKGDARLQELRSLGIEDKILVYTNLARSERAELEVRDLTRMADERAEGIRKQGEMIRLRDQTIEKMRTENVEAAKRSGEQVRNRDATIERLNERVEATRKLVEERTEALRAANARAADLERAGAKLETRAAAAEAARDELRARIRVQDERLTEGREGRKTLQERLDQANREIAAMREKLALLEAGRAAAEKAASEFLQARAAADNQLAEISVHLAALAASHERARISGDQRLEALGTALDQARRGAEAAANTLARRLTRLDTDTELLSLRAEHLEEIVSEQRARGQSADPQAAPEEDWLTGERRQEPSRRPKPR